MFLMVLYTFFINRVSPTPEIRKKAVPDLLQPRQRSGLKTQYVLRHRLIFLLYIVFTPFPATLRAGADIAALFIPSPCYTSGKLLYDGKSDLPETGIR